MSNTAVMSASSSQVSTPIHYQRLHNPFRNDRICAPDKSTRFQMTTRSQTGFQQVPFQTYLDHIVWKAPRTFIVKRYRFGTPL